MTIFNRDTPVAELVPARASRGDEPVDRLAATVDQLAREGIVRRGSGEPLAELFNPPEGPPSGVLHTLLEERASGR